MECLGICEFMRPVGGSPPFFFLNPYGPAESLLKERGYQYSLANPEQASVVAAKARPGALVVMNHRRASLEAMRELRQAGLKLCLVDQLGEKQVSADLLVNSSIVKDWTRYEFPDGEPESLLGGAYALLRAEFESFHGVDRRFPAAPCTVLVTMGGVDRTGASLRLVEALGRLGREVKKEFILGKGFAHIAHFRELMAAADSSFSWAQGVDDLSTRMARSQVAISAGGNTLYELACVGTPALVLWEDPHEKLQGEAFEAEGAAVTIGNGISTSIDVISERVIHLLSDSATLQKMSNAGKAVVDGRGLARVSASLRRIHG